VIYSIFYLILIVIHDQPVQSRPTTERRTPLSSPQWGEKVSFLRVTPETLIWNSIIPSTKFAPITCADTNSCPFPSPLQVLQLPAYLPEGGSLPFLSGGSSGMQALSSAACTEACTEASLH